MEDKFEELISIVRSCSNEQKQRIFSEIRDSISIHDLEKAFNVRAEVLMEAIGRAADLTQRGVRGVIAETIFALEVVPTLEGWQDDPPVGNLSYDACLCKNNCRIRTQVKMQRKAKGQPKKSTNGSFVVEVQRTRSGTKDGLNTRPYKFGEFDLLAVCMEPSTGAWTSFMYAPASGLEASPTDATIIKTFQDVPAYSDQDQGIWTSSLLTALERIPCQGTGTGDCPTKGG